MKYPATLSLSGLLLMTVCGLASLPSSAAKVEPSSSSTTTHDWPRFRGPDAKGTWNPANLPSEDDLIDLEPRRLWTVKIGSGYGGITTVGKRLFVMDYLKQPQEIERITCFDTDTGKVLWQHEYAVDYTGIEYASGPRASVTVHDGKAYALGTTGMTTRVDVESGSIDWQINTVKEFGTEPPRWGLAGSPLIWQDKLILHLGAKPAGSLVALQPDTGKLIWRSGDDPAGYSTPVLVEHGKHPVLIQWGPENVFATDPANGTELWKFPYKIQYGVSIAQPIFHEGLLMVSSYWHGTRVLRLAETKPDTDPELVWSIEDTLRGLMSQPLIRDDVIYLLDRSEGIIAFELKTGKILWKDDHHFTPKDRNPQISLVWADQKNGIASGLNADGELFFARFDVEGFEEFSRHQIIGKTWAHPAFAGNRVYARSDTELAAWELWEQP